MNLNSLMSSLAAKFRIGIPEKTKLPVDEKVPVTVFTGFLGSGKTTIIMNLIRQMPKGYKMVLLKNEFGDAKIDSELARENNIRVTEMLNGCLCCVLVGKLNNALEQILDEQHPDRIIIETSGSAYPAPIAWEVRKMGEVLKLDSIVTVIDAVNFEGYKDKSYTAKLQAEFTDLILINKHEEVSEKELDQVLDDVYELNPSTPKVKTKKGEIPPELIFGLDTKLFQLVSNDDSNNNHHDRDEHHHDKEVETYTLLSESSINFNSLNEFLKGLPKWDFYRIKGIINTDRGVVMVNGVFGRIDYILLTKYSGGNRLTFMGKNLDLYKDKISEFFN